MQGILMDVVLLKSCLTLSDFVPWTVYNRQVALLYIWLTGFSGHELAGRRKGRNLDIRLPFFNLSCLGFLVDPGQEQLSLDRVRKAGKEKHCFPNPFRRHLHPSRFWISVSETRQESNSSLLLSMKGWYWRASHYYYYYALL